MMKAAYISISEQATRSLLVCGCLFALAMSSASALGQSGDSYSVKNAAYDGPAMGQYRPTPATEDYTDPVSGGYAYGPHGGYAEGSMVMPYEDQLFLEEPPLLLSTGSWLRRGCWYTQQEFVMWLKNPPREFAIANDQVNAFQVRDQITTASSTFTFQPGARIVLGRNLGRDSRNRDQSIEFAFTGLFDWSTTYSLDAITQGSAGQAASLFSTLGGGGSIPEGWSSLDNITYTYEADFNSFELNLITRARPNRDQLVLRPDGSWARQASNSKLWTYEFGLRTILMNESFRYTGVGAFNSDGDPVAHSGDYTVRTHNGLFGLQGGATYDFQHENWEWGIRIKGGLFANFADRQSRVITNSQGVQTGGQAQDIDDETLTALLEGSMFVRYYLRPNLIVRASYDVLYLQGMALAPEQLGLGNQAFPPFNMGGDALLQGGFFGFESVW